MASRSIRMILSLLLFGNLSCRTTQQGAGSEVKGGEANSPFLEEVRGLDQLTNEPVITQVPEDVVVGSDWGYSSGREYWLYSTRGRYMTFSTDKYAPYQNSAACAGLENDPNSACSVSPGVVAQACQYIASLTLKGIMESHPPELADLRRRFGGNLWLFGWMNDGHSDGRYATASWQGPFIWRSDGDGIQLGRPCPSDYRTLSGYIKWVSSVDRNGICKSPSRGQFDALIAKVKSCLEANNPVP